MGGDRKNKTVGKTADIFLGASWLGLKTAPVPQAACLELLVSLHSAASTKPPLRRPETGMALCERTAARAPNEGFELDSCTLNKSVQVYQGCSS